MPFLTQQDLQHTTQAPKEASDRSLSAIRRNDSIQQLLLSDPEAASVAYFAQRQAICRQATEGETGSSYAMCSRSPSYEAAFTSLLRTL